MLRLVRSSLTWCCSTPRNTYTAEAVTKPIFGGSSGQNPNTRATWATRSPITKEDTIWFLTSVSLRFNCHTPWAISKVDTKKTTAEKRKIFWRRPKRSVKKANETKSVAKYPMVLAALTKGIFLSVETKKMFSDSKIVYITAM